MELTEFIMVLPKSKKIEAIKDKRRWLDIARKYRRHNPICEVCGSNNSIEIHHIKPAALYPNLIYDETNLISLCRKGNNCHLRFGHNGNYNNYNPDILLLKKF